MTEPAITPELVAKHNLTTEEYATLKSILGREPSYTELGIFSVIREALVNLQRFLSGEQGDAVMAFLPVVMNVVAELADILFGELLIGHFDFLQADDIRLVFVDQRRQLMRARAQPIDIERNDLHRKAPG